jgi:hypothetical protein
MYDIVYKSRTAIRAQALSYFKAEWMETQTPPKNESWSTRPSTLMDPYYYKVQEHDYW